METTMEVETGEVPCTDCEKKDAIIEALNVEVDGLLQTIIDKDEMLKDTENMLDIRMKQLAELRKALDL